MLIYMIFAAQVLQDGYDVTLPHSVSIRPLLSHGCKNICNCDNPRPHMKLTGIDVERVAAAFQLFMMESRTLGELAESTNHA